MKRHECAIAPQLITPAGEERAKAIARLDAGERKARPSRKKANERGKKPHPPPGKILRREKLTEQHGDALQSAQRPAKARAKTKIRFHAPCDLQRFYFRRHRVSAVHDRELRKITQPKAAGAQAP